MIANSSKDLSDLVRNKLNSLPEKDQQGNQYRLFWQFITYLIGNEAESSNDTSLKVVGKKIKLGAKKSFLDYTTTKIENWIDRFFDNMGSKTCIYCGHTSQYNAKICFNCRNYFY